MQRRIKAILFSLILLFSLFSYRANCSYAFALGNNISLNDAVIVDIAAGTDHNLALDQEGNLWAWGRNDYGQVGNGTTINQTTPVQIMRGHKFKKISAGNGFSAAIDENDFLYTWGNKYNLAGEIIYVPTLYGTEKYEDVLCTVGETLIVPKGGNIKLFGYGRYTREYGLDKITQVGYEKRPHIKNNGQNVYDFCHTDSSIVYTVVLKNYVPNVICADSLYNSYYYYNNYGSYLLLEAHTFLIDSNYDLHYLCRERKDGEYESYHFFDGLDVSYFDNIDLLGVSVRKTLISSEYNKGFVSFLSKDGSIYSAGCNEFGGFGNEEYLSTPYSSTPIKASIENKIVDISVGENHVLALDENGKVYSWGNNAYGQLGHDDTTVRTIPTMIKTFDETKSFNFNAFSNEICSDTFYQYGGSNYTLLENGLKGTFNIDKDSGEFTYTPNENEYGEDTAVISISYSGVIIDYQVNVYIDRKPVFMGGTPSFNVECGQSYKGVAPATDPDNDKLTYLIAKAPLKGEAVLNNNSGSFTYKAGNDMAGGDSFIIAVSDGYCTVQYPVSVHIQSIITYSDITDINIDLQKANVYSGNVNAVDIDGDTLAYSIEKNGAKGSVTIDSLGNYTYTANENSYGQDSFVIKVDDGYKSLKINYNVNIYSVSDAGTTLLAKITKGTAYEGKILTDAMGAVPEYSINSQPLNGSVTIDSQTGDYTYIPNLGSTGDDSFDVFVDYGYGNYTITIHIYQNTIPNDASVTTEITTPENTNYSGTVQCIDIDGDILAYSIKTHPTKGSLSINPTTGEYIYYPNPNVAGDDSFEINVNDGTDLISNHIDVHIESEIQVDLKINKTISQNTSLSARVDASDKDNDTLTYSISKNAKNGIANIDSLTGDYIYIPNTNYYGEDRFEVTVDDGISPKIVEVVVFINRMPIADNITINLETKGMTVTGSAICSDPDGDVLTYSLVAQPSQGSVIVNSSSGGFAYTPDVNAHGNDYFQIKATDGCDDIIVNVNIHNETDVSLEEQKTTIVVNQGKSTTGQVLAVDLDGDELSYSIINFPTKGTLNINSSTGAWTYYADSTAEGRDLFEVQITDGNSVISLEYTLIINTPASFDSDSYSIQTNQNGKYTGVVNAVDADGDSVEYLVVSDGSKGSVSLDSSTGRYIYIPKEGAAGDDSFVLGVSDGNFITEIVVNVHIESNVMSQSPIINETVNKNGVVSGITDVFDADGDNLTYSIYQQGEKGSASITSDGNWMYFANNGAGDDIFIIEVTDGQSSAYVTVYIHISSEPTVGETNVNITVGEGGSITKDIDAFDEDGDELVYSISSLPQHGTVSINAQTGEYTYKLNSSTESDFDTFVIEVSDGVNKKSIVVDVKINNSPTSKDVNIVIGQGGEGQGTIHGTDNENDKLSYEVATQGKFGTVSINEETGEFIYVVNSKDYYGYDSFTIKITDGYTSTLVVVSVVVIQNSAPSGNSGTIYVDAGSSGEGKIDISDLENDILVYEIELQGDKGVAYIDSETGEYTYRANLSTEGYDCFIIKVSDGYNTRSYIVEVYINWVDAHNSWAIPTTIGLGVLSVISIAGCILSISKNKKIKKAI